MLLLGDVCVLVLKWTVSRARGAHSCCATKVRCGACSYFKTERLETRNGLVRVGQRRSCTYMLMYVLTREREGGRGWNGRVVVWREREERCGARCVRVRAVRFDWGWGFGLCAMRVCE